MDEMMTVFWMMLTVTHTIHPPAGVVYTVNMMLYITNISTADVTQQPLALVSGVQLVPGILTKHTFIYLPILGSGLVILNNHFKDKTFYQDFKCFSYNYSVFAR